MIYQMPKLRFLLAFALAIAWFIVFLIAGGLL